MKSTGQVKANEGNFTWNQKIRGEWKEFDFIPGFTYKHTSEEFNMIYPVVQDSGVMVEVSEGMYNEIVNDFIPRWKEMKLSESRNGGMDFDAIAKRGITGFLGEAAVETLLGIPVLDRDKNGRLDVRKSTTFHGGDLERGTGLSIGVKSVELPKFPTLRRNVRRPQVICFRVSTRGFLIGGYASMRVQREFMDSRYIINDRLRNKRLNNGQIEKSAFYGFHKLEAFTNLDELRKLYYKK